MNGSDTSKNKEKIDLESILAAMDGTQDIDERPYLDRTKEIKDLISELAFHEASHFVFDCMAQKYVDGFAPINFIISCAEKLNEEKYNVVNGFAPDIPKHKTYVKSHDEEAKGYLEFYNKDRKRLAAKLLSVVAGYSSYQIFIENDKYYIGANIEDKKIEKEGLYKFNYHSMKNSINSGTSDFNFIRKKLRIYYSLTGNNAVKAVEILTNKVQGLMKIQAVNDCIRYVKNQLIQNECEKIEGLSLIKLIREIKRITNKIEFDLVLDELKEKII